MGDRGTSETPDSPATVSRLMSCETTLWKRNCSPGKKFFLNELCDLQICVPPASWNQCPALSIFPSDRLTPVQEPEQKLDFGDFFPTPVWIGILIFSISRIISDLYLDLSLQSWYEIF